MWITLAKAPLGVGGDKAHERHRVLLSNAVLVRELENQWQRQRESETRY